MQNILIIGSSSAIARALARQYAAKGCHLFLMARNEEALLTQQSDLRLRGAASVNVLSLDVNEFEQHRAAVEKARAALGSVDIAVICHGTLPDQQQCQHNFALMQQEFNTNALSTISLLTCLAPLMKAQGSGSLAVISSVAGDRGRQSNYIYGAAKAMVSTYLQGLRNELFPHGVNVIDIKPGFVDTPMTASFKKGPLWVQPETVATIIRRSISKKRHTVYAPWFWRYIMLIITSIPEFLFKRLKL